MEVPRWGSLRRLEPISGTFGYDRGNPVDRHYIEAFLTAHRGDIKGRCLEVRDTDYLTRFGGSAVDRADVLDVDAANPKATVVADLGIPGSLPEGVYDCVLITQTIQYLQDPAVGMVNVWAALASGGVLLVTVPAIQSFHPWGDVAVDRWRFAPPALEALLRDLAPAEVDVRGWGNLTVAVAALMGLAAEDLRPDELAAHDPGYPVVVTGRAVKP